LRHRLPSKEGTCRASIESEFNRCDEAVTAEFTQEGFQDVYDAVVTLQRTSDAIVSFIDSKLVGHESTFEKRISELEARLTRLLEVVDSARLPD
jgi:hypothetical protein